jgi:hypothetical protein
LLYYRHRIRIAKSIQRYGSRKLGRRFCLRVPLPVLTLHGQHDAEATASFFGTRRRVLWRENIDAVGIEYVMSTISDGDRSEGQLLTDFLRQ